MKRKPKKPNRNNPKLVWESKSGFLAGVGGAAETTLDELKKQMKFAVGAQTIRTEVYVVTAKCFYRLDGEYEIGFKEQLRQDMIKADMFEGGRVLACWFKGEAAPEEAVRLGYK